MIPMSGKPLVSVIIDNYNYGRFLKGSIESALGQTYGKLEVIVVDDGSTDNSREIITSYGDLVQPIFKENGGQASAFNAGFAASHGEIIIFLDADDMLLPHTVRRVVETFEKNPDAAKVQYRMEVINAAGARSGAIKPLAHVPIRTGDLRRYVLSFPFDMTWMPTSGNAIAARVLHQIFPAPEREFRILADYYVAHLAALFGSVIFLDDVGAYYRVHSSNNYEVSAPTLNLDQIRQTITHSYQTHIYIKKFANQLGFSSSPGVADDVLSVSLLAQRLISLKMDPGRHPLRDDRTMNLLRQGMVASLRRFDISPSMKILFLAWFVAMATAPKPLARWLAEKFVFPETRPQINNLLRVLHSVD